MEASQRQTGALFVGESEPDCLSPVVDCGPNPAYLEITIDIPNPSSFPTTSDYTIYGRCNSGNYPYNAIQYRIATATDPTNYFFNATVKSEDNPQGDGIGYCKNGRYDMILPSMVQGVVYILRVDMIGYTDAGTGGNYNSEAMGRALIDYSFFVPTP